MRLLLVLTALVFYAATAKAQFGPVPPCAPPAPDLVWRYVPGTPYGWTFITEADYASALARPRSAAPALRPANGCPGGNCDLQYQRLRLLRWK